MGVILILVSSLFFTLSSMFGKIVTNTTSMSGVVTSFSRFLLGAIFMFIYILFTKRSLKAVNLKPIALRGVFNSLSMISFSAGFRFTTITNVNMLHMSYPVFVVLLAPYYTKEKIKKESYIYLVLAMLGSYIVANPSFGHVNIGDVLAFISAIVGAFSIMSLTLAKRENEGYIIVFYVMLIGTFMNLPFAFKDLMTFEMKGLIPVLLSAICGVVAQIVLTKGYEYVDSATGSMVATSRIAMSAILGYLLLSEPIDLRIVIGIVLITGALIGISGFFDKWKKDHVREEAVER